MDDLRFETPEAAAKTAKSLRTWGVFMEQNADKQITGDYYDDDGGMCAIGAGAKAFGYAGRELADWALECKGDIGDPVQNAVGAIVVRQLGLGVELNPEEDRVIPLLNDCAGVTFPQFATACRALSSIIEERYVVDAVPVSERELVEA